MLATLVKRSNQLRVYLPNHSWKSTANPVTLISNHSVCQSSTWYCILLKWVNVWINVGLCVSLSYVSIYFNCTYKIHTWSPITEICLSLPIKDIWLIGSDIHTSLLSDVSIRLWLQKEEMCLLGWLPLKHAIKWCVTHVTDTVWMMISSSCLYAFSKLCLCQSTAG